MARLTRLARALRQPPRSLRVLLAGNGGAFTLDGTRTFVVGSRRAAVLDPGPDEAAHLDAVARAVDRAEAVVVLLTHGHDDHAAGAHGLAARLGVRVLGAGPVDDALAGGASVATDAGDLTAVSTPGHAREHLCFHWPARAAVFVGDLLLGAGDTTWVGGYPGCVADYLASLERVRALEARTLLPAHGSPLAPASRAIERFERHRLGRIDQVRVALDAGVGPDARALVEHIYPGLSPRVAPAALASVRAVLVHLDLDPGPGGWFETG